MSKIKLKPSYVLYLFFLVTVFLFHFNINAHFGDDQALIDTYFGMPLFDVIVGRYNTFSARFAIDAVMIYLALHNMIYWKIADFLAMATLPLIFFYLFKSTERTRQLAIMLIGIYPMLDMASCGWIACTTNYIWPLWCVCFIGYMLKKAYFSEKLRFYDWIIGVASCIYGSSHELPMICIFVFFVLYLFACVREKVRFKYGLIPLWVLNVVCIGIVLNSPARFTRIKEESAAYMPAFTSFNLGDKIYLGIVNFVRLFMANFQALYLIFVIAIAIFVWMKTESAWRTLCCLVPVGISSAYVFAPMFIDENFIGFGGNALLFTKAPLEQIQEIPPITLSFFLPVIYFILLILCVGFGLWTLSKDNKNEFIMLLVLSGIAIGSTVIMGFSPTIYASMTRPFIYFNFIMIYIVLHCFNKEDELESGIKSGAYPIAFVILLTFMIENCLTTIRLGVLA